MSSDKKTNISRLKFLFLVTLFSLFDYQIQPQKNSRIIKKNTTSSKKEKHTSWHALEATLFNLFYLTLPTTCNARIRCREGNKQFKRMKSYGTHQQD
jgi:hypothetical protein